MLVQILSFLQIFVGKLRLQKAKQPKPPFGAAGVRLCDASSDPLFLFLFFWWEKLFREAEPGTRQGGSIC